MIEQIGEKYLRQEGANPEHPNMMPCAPTGTAAGHIDGQTLHRAFNLPFRNEYISYSDKLLDFRREQLKNLQFVIVDEMSMMKSDQLFQLDQRLKDIKQKPNIDFGGISVILLGDITQLPPVQGKFIFDEPACDKYRSGDAWDPLSEKFSVINLVTNHRQGSDKDYADLLNRMRIGECTDDDINPNLPDIFYPLPLPTGVPRDPDKLKKL